MTDVTDGADASRSARPRLFLPIAPALAGALARIGPFLVAPAGGLSASLGYNTQAACGPETAHSIAIAVGAVVAMAQTLILAARPRRLKPLFGGLDRMYRVHNWLGSSAQV